MKNLIFMVLAPLLALIMMPGISFSKNVMALPDSSTVRINVYFPETTADDELKLYLYVDTVNAKMVLPDHVHEFISRQSKPGLFSFQFHIPDRTKLPGVYILINKLSNAKELASQPQDENRYDPKFTILDYYFVQDSDEITIQAKKKPGFAIGRSVSANMALSFNGRGAFKYKLRCAVDSIRFSKDFSRDFFLSDSTYNNDNGEIRVANELMEYMKPFERQLNKEAYEELRIHAYYSTKSIESLLIPSFLHHQYNGASGRVRKNFLKSYERADTTRWYTFDPNSLERSIDFWTAEMQEYRLRSIALTGRTTADSIMNDLKTIKSPIIRENLLILTLKGYAGQFKNLADVLKSTSKYMVSSNGKRQFDRLYQVQAGLPAFDFSLTDVNGKTVRLSDFKGKVVFIDFWYTGCENCSLYYQNVLSKVEEQYKPNRDFVFLSVSIDKNKEFWINSVKRNQYTSMTATNLYTNGEGTSNDAVKFYQVIGYPRPLIIDRKQNIFSVDESLRDEDKLISALNTASRN